MSTNKEYLKILWSLVIFSALFVASYARADMKDLIFISKGAIPIEKLEDVSKKAIFIGRQNLPFVFKKDILKDGLNLVDLFNVFNLDFLAKRESRKIRLDLPAADYFLITPNNTFDSYINVSVKDNSLLIKNKAREFESLSDIFQPVAFEEDRTDNLPSNLCRTNKSRPDQETISQVSAGQFKLRAKNELVCYNKWFESKGNVMKVSFEYKHLTGDNPKFTLWRKSADGAINQEIYSEKFKPKQDWNKFEKLFDIPEGGEENIGIYLYSSSSGNYMTENLYRDINVLTAEKEDIFKKDSKKQDGKFQKFGPFYLEGSIDVSYSDLENPSIYLFDENENVAQNFCRTNKSRPDQETISQVSAGQFKLRAKNELVCYNKWFETNGNVMKVSFEYKHLTGDNPKFTIWAKSVDGSLNKEIYSEDLETTSGWTKFEKLIEVPEDKKNNIGIYLYSFSKGNYLTENSYKGIKIELFNWPLAERIFLAPEKFFNDDQNKYEVKQINFSKYKIKITDIDEPFLLNFLESFDNYWRLYARNGFSKKRLTDHFMINGYANGFIIDPKILEEKGILEMKENGKYDLELVMEYFPQRLFYLALLVSLLALFFSAFIVRKMKNEKA